MPESAVLGWDVAFTDNGPIIIEVNGAGTEHTSVRRQETERQTYYGVYIK